MTLALANTATLRTGPMRRYSFLTGDEQAFAGQSIVGYLSTGALVDSIPLGGLSVALTERVPGDYWGTLAGSLMSSEAAGVAAAGTPVYAHFGVDNDSTFHEVVGPLLVQQVRPLPGFAASVAWRNGVFFELTLTENHLTGVERPWVGAALTVFLSLSDAVDSVAIDAALSKSVGAGIYERLGGVYVGGFYGDDVADLLASDVTVYAVAVVAPHFRAASPVIVRDTRRSA